MRNQKARYDRIVGGGANWGVAGRGAHGATSSMVDIGYV